MFRRVGLLTALTAAACCSKSEVKATGNAPATDPVTAPVPGKPTLSVFALAEVRGQIGPCGCTTDPLGDISRTAQLIAQARAAGPVLVVDAGSLLYSQAQAPIPALLEAQEEESARRLIDAQEQAARARENSREVALANEALRRSQSRSQRRADQIALLASVAHKIAPVLDPDRLMQVAAATIQAHMSHTYVAVVVLDDEGVLVGRWAGHPGVGRRSGGRAQGPPGGVIGRAIRQRAPQVVGDVSRDPDYHPDVPGTRAEMVVPLLEGGVAVGAIDFQSERAGAFDLDDVAAGEAMGEFLVVALRNARLYQEAREAPPA